MNRRHFALTPLLLPAIGGRPATAQPAAAATRIRIVAGDVVLTGTLEAHPTAADFAALLPLRLRVEDYAATEKIADLPRKLSLAGAPAGADPSPGDIAYYAPWGNLAMYYRDAGYASGLVRLGRLDAPPAALQRLPAGPVTIERAD